MPEIDLLDAKVISRQVLQIIHSAPIPGLNEIPQCMDTGQAIERLVNSMPSLAPALQAGLWLLAGELDRSHSISQSLPTEEGSYWHAIMHRREGDFWNSKYWYRKATGHPVLAKLATKIANPDTPLPAQSFGQDAMEKLSDPTRVAETLVDQVELAVKKHPDWQFPLQRVCWWEWQLLFQHCWNGL